MRVGWECRLKKVSGLDGGSQAGVTQEGSSCSGLWGREAVPVPNSWKELAEQLKANASKPKKGSVVQARLDIIEKMLREKK